VATNRTLADGRQLKVICTDPTTPASGDPVIVGNIPGVALTDEVATFTTIDTEGVYDLLVHANDGGSSAVAVGDIIYYNSGNTPKLDKAVAGVRFGYALEVITGDAEAIIKVKLGY